MAMLIVMAGLGSAIHAKRAPADRDADARVKPEHDAIVQDCGT